MKCKVCGWENSPEVKNCKRCQNPLQDQQPALGLEADVVFCFDTTGSMRDEIEDLKTNALAFAQGLNDEGVLFQVALIEFRDLDCPEAAGLAQMKVVVPLSTNVMEFEEAIKSLTANGGGDEPESSLDAIWEALSLQGFRESCRKYIVLVTDASPKDPDKQGRSSKDLIDHVLQRGDIRFMLVTPEIEPYMTMAKMLGGRAMHFPIVDAAGKRAEFTTILDRIAKGTAMMASKVL